MSQTISIKSMRPTKELPFLLRVIWFFVFGWELTGVWILVAWALNVTIIGLPVGLWMINRVPQVLTLKSRSGMYVQEGGRAYYLGKGQTAWPLRALYFVVFGWWVSLLWAGAAWLLCASIIGLPFGIMMLHTLPFITTLQRG